MAHNLKNKKRVTLSRGQLITHYSSIPFLLIVPILTAVDIFKIYVTHTYKGVLLTNDLIAVSIPFLVLAITFTIIQYRKLFFKEIEFVYSDEDFQDAANRSVEDLGWRIVKNQKNFFRAYRPWNWNGSWGEMITIIKYKDRLLINSICDPDSFSSVVSYGWNRKNITTFLKNLTDVVNDKPQEQKIEKVIKEWTTKKIIFRIFAYPFGIFLVVFGFYSVLHPIDIRTILAGLGAIIIAALYFYSDIKILTKPSNQERNSKM